MTRWIALAIVVLVLGVAAIAVIGLATAHTGPASAPNVEGTWLCIGVGGALPEGPLWVPDDAHPSADDPYVPCTDEILDAIANLRGGVRPTLPAGPP